MAVAIARGGGTRPRDLVTNDMKHNKNHDNATVPGPNLLPVRFEFLDPKATSVAVAGTFNHWNPETKALHRTAEGVWLKETVLEPGTYEYRLVVDGRWLADPKARESVDNPFGGKNSVLHVGPRLAEATHLADAARLPLKNANPTGPFDNDAQRR